MTPEEYHQLDAMSRSRIVDLMRGPAFFKGRRDGLVPDRAAKSPWAIFGDLVHLAVLQPHRYPELVAVKPPMSKARTRGLDSNGVWTNPETGERVLGKDAAIAWEKANAGKRIITMGLQKKVTICVAAICSDPRVAPLLSGPTEVPILWKDERTGLPCKALLDARPDDGVIVDLKVTYDPSPDAWRRTSASHHLHVQDAWYTSGEATRLGVPHEEVDPMIFVVVRSSPPHEVALYSLGWAERALGLEVCRDALEIVSERTAAGEWRAPWQITHQPIEVTWPDYRLENPLEKLR